MLNVEYSQKKRDAIEVIYFDNELPYIFRVPTIF